MEILLILILISILWGNSTASSIVRSIEDIKTELQYGKNYTEIKELLSGIKDTIPGWGNDYTYELKQLYNELENIHEELKWYKSSSFAGTSIDTQREMIEKLESQNDASKEMIEVQQETVAKLEDILETLQINK